MYSNSFGVSKVDERKTAAQEIWTSARKTLTQLLLIILKKNIVYFKIRS